MIFSFLQFFWGDVKVPAAIQPKKKNPKMREVLLIFFHTDLESHDGFRSLYLGSESLEEFERCSKW